MADEQSGDNAATAEPSTVDAPARWSGSAAVPEAAPRKPWWARRQAEPAAEPDDPAMTPPVDPWEGQDTPWDPMPLPPEVLPPTRVEPPPAVARPAVPYPPPPPRYQRRAVQPVHPHAPHQRPLPPPPPRRRRRWPRRLAIVTLLGTLCCCGVPALLLLPAAGQYPVTAVLPPSVSDLDLRDDAASRRAAQRLSREVHSAAAFAGIYSDGNGKRVTVFGTTGLRFTPKEDVEAQISRLTPDYDIRDVQTFDLGVAGVHERCGIGRANGATVVVCAWADHGSLATVVLTRRSVADSAELTGVLRNAILIRG
ncbi:MAG TPA: hypothetical protein VFH03_04995 [Actinoplanes sp.]|nr:hypothetical protein [Actinoplanes sp.]